jgi:Na+/proline symporter
MAALLLQNRACYLPIYVGPVIIIPTWMIILKRIVRISRNKISSIADFISLR